MTSWVMVLNPPFITLPMLPRSEDTLTIVASSARCLYKTHDVSPIAHTARKRIK